MALGVAILTAAAGAGLQGQAARPACKDPSLPVDRPVADLLLVVR